ncbi:helix-turn-helix transcriptional regulator [Geodermatophilus sp. SYSU D00758]
MTETSPGWTFLSNHGHVLVSLAADPEVRMRDVATRVGITERAVQMIVSDLEQAGYVVRERVGRRNHYTVVNHGRFRHPLEQHVRIGDFLALVLRDAGGGASVNGAEPAGRRA